MIKYDWAHIYVHDGLADVELGMLMKVMQKHKSATSFNELGEYVSTFSMPKGAPDLKHLFTSKANKLNTQKDPSRVQGQSFSL